MPSQLVQWLQGDVYWENNASVSMKKLKICGISNGVTLAIPVIVWSARAQDFQDQLSQYIIWLNSFFIDWIISPQCLAVLFNTSAKNTCSFNSIRINHRAVLQHNIAELYYTRFLYCSGTVGACVLYLSYFAPQGIDLLQSTLRVPNKNGVSLLYIMLEIHHSGREPLKCTFYDHYHYLQLCD